MITSKLFKDRFITVSYHDQNESINFQQSISDDDFKKICEIIKVDDIHENLTDNDEIRIFLQTEAQHRDAVIQGTMFGDGVSKKVAENIYDGIEMSDEEFEKLNDESE